MRSIQNITVIGAGTMGRGIANVALLAGYNVVLNDISIDVLEKAKDNISININKSLERGIIDRDVAVRADELLTLSCELSQAVAEAELIIEAVPEIMSLKIETLKQALKYAPGNVILASNTSTMSITEMASAVGRPEKFIGMHFFNPVHKMKLIEIIKGLDTDNETLSTCLTVAAKMGKETVEVNEFPGFVTSRISCLVGNEAYQMLMEGVASKEDIDKAIKMGLNYPMGPLELTDLVGLDARLRNLQYLHDKLGEKYRPCPLLEKYVKAGKLGRKTGEGFYKYD